MTRIIDLGYGYGRIEGYGSEYASLTFPLTKYQILRLCAMEAISENEARDIIAKAKPVYYTITGLHSPETGGPEMFMELAYRLAVDESPRIRAIRENVIVLLVPVADPDGRDRMVDIYNYRSRPPYLGSQRNPLQLLCRQVSHRRPPRALGVLAIASIKPLEMIYNHLRQMR